MISCNAIWYIWQNIDNIIWYDVKVQGVLTVTTHIRSYAWRVKHACTGVWLTSNSLKPLINEVCKLACQDVQLTGEEYLSEINIDMWVCFWSSGRPTSELYSFFSKKITWKKIAILQVRTKRIFLGPIFLLNGFCILGGKIRIRDYMRATLLRCFAMLLLHTPSWNVRILQRRLPSLV